MTNAFRSCPAWCTTSAAHHAMDDEGRPLHIGERIGYLPFRPERLDSPDGPGSITLAWAEPKLLDELTVESLRQLAVDAVLAAQWLELVR